MIWPFGGKPTLDEDPPPTYVRLASPEFVSGLVEIAEMYEAREKRARSAILVRAEELSRKEFFNHRELEDQYIGGGMRREIVAALKWQGLASELRDWIRDYEHRGRRPPYMSQVPPSEKENAIETILRRQ